MVQETGSKAALHYRAFISYSHADAGFAAWLHRRLESWRSPQGERLAPVFIDRAELAAGPDLPAQVREALERSAALVVIASPTARMSRWVEQEISLFRDLYPDRPVLTALIEGEPAEAFPSALILHGDREIEPLAADFRKGQDGRRLGFLKIAAGLSGVPLDRLVQRDGQIRQRRVMTVTAAAVLLSVVLGALLVEAVRARGEAERQRTEAEGMVEFMLTDLRDRLKGVGRLDIMDAVNERAMARYAREEDLSALPPDMLLRRARLLQAMAEDDFDSAANAARGKTEAAEAWRITNDLLQRDPTDPQRLFAHAQSEYYAGYVGMMENDKAKVGEHWQGYLRLASQLVEREPGKPEWQRELGYANGNMCTLHLTSPVNAKAALTFCAQARQAAEQAAKSNPGDLEAANHYANRLAWEADAHAALGDRQRSLTLRQQESGVAHGMTRRFGKDARAFEALMRSDIGLAKAQIAAGQTAAARTTVAHGQELGRRLQRLDPANGAWADWLGMLDELGRQLD